MLASLSNRLAILKTSELQIRKLIYYLSINQLQRKSIDKMDSNPSSIITQVSRETADNPTTGNGHINHSAVNGSVQSKSKKEKQSFQSWLCCIRKPRKKRDSKNSRGDGQQETWSPVDQTTQQDDENSSSSVTPVIPNLTISDRPDNGTTLVNGERHYLLPPANEKFKNKKCAVIDLDETLVHSSFKPINNADFIVPVEIDGTVHQVYVLKRPHVDTYLERMGEMYECVLFTASLAKYADPVSDLLDPTGVFTSRLFRESCVFHRGNYVKDLNLIGRDLNKVIIIDNSPASYIFHPSNAVPVISWFDDPTDTELLDILPFLEAIAESEDVYTVLQSQGFTSHAQESTATIRRLTDPGDDEIQR